MDDALPIRYTQAFNLTDLGISKDLIKPGNLGFESEKYISLKEGGVSTPTLFSFLIERFVSFRFLFISICIGTRCSRYWFKFCSNKKDNES